MFDKSDKPVHVSCTFSPRSLAINIIMFSRWTCRKNRSQCTINRLIPTFKSSLAKSKIENNSIYLDHFSRLAQFDKKTCMKAELVWPLTEQYSAYYWDDQTWSVSGSPAPLCTPTARATKGQCKFWFCNFIVHVSYILVYISVSINTLRVICSYTVLKYSRTQRKVAPSHNQGDIHARYARACPQWSRHLVRGCDRVVTRDTWHRVTMHGTAAVSWPGRQLLRMWGMA